MNKFSKGIVVSAFMSVAGVAVVGNSLQMNDVVIDTSIQNQDSINFHNIPVEDAMIAIYASYFSGADKDTKAFDLDSRATNTFGMNDALNENFISENAPWLVVDSLSDGRNNSQVGHNMQGAHFVTMYHKDSKQIVISMPGMEYDYGPADTIDDAIKLFQGNYEETQALKNYVELIENKIANSEFLDINGEALDIDFNKPIIASHSLGSKATHVMSMAGYQTIMLEPRPITDGYVAELGELYNSTFGEPKTAQDTIALLNDNTISLRAGHANIWNSPLMPWTDVHHVPNTYVYGTGDDTTFSDRHVAGDHAAEVAVPSVMRAIDPNSSASEAPKGKTGMRVQRLVR